MENIEMSLDKVSFTAKIMSTIDATGINELLSSGYIECEYYYSPKNFMYQHNFKLADGSFFQYGEFQKEQNARLEFNPNKMDYSVLRKIIARLKYPKITRLDWAIDYFDVDMADYEIRDLVGRTQEEYKSRSKKRETLYIGSRSSDNFIRVYNKAAEQKHRTRLKEEEYTGNKKWWRIEAVQKDFSMMVEKELESIIEIEGIKSRLIKKEKVKTEGYLFQNPFQCIEVYEKLELGSDGLKMQEKAMLFYLQHNPAEWQNLSPNSKRKYELLQYALCTAPIENQPKEIFEKEKSRLAETLEELLRPALDNGKYLIGDVSNLEYSMMYLREQNKA